MIHPSQIIGFKKRIFLNYCIKYLSIKSDTFVFLCKDFGLGPGKICFLLEYYYKIEHAEAKWIAFSSPAWGEKSAEIVRNSQVAFDLAKEGSSKTD